MSYEIDRFVTKRHIPIYDLTFLRVECILAENEISNVIVHCKHSSKESKNIPRNDPLFDDMF